MGQIFSDADAFALFELRRLGYDVETGREVASSTEDADDLLLMTLGDAVSPVVFAGLVWASQNRSTCCPATYPRLEQQADLLRLVEASDRARYPDRVDPEVEELLNEITESLRTLLPDDLAREWMTRSNDNPIFGGQTPLAYAKEHGIDGLRSIRDLLAGAIQGKS